MSLYSASTFCRQKLASGILVMDASCSEAVGSAYRSRTHSGNQVRRIYVADDYYVQPDVQADVPLSVTEPNLQTESNDWVAEPKKMADGVIAARTLFSGESLQSVMRVINLSDEPYNFRKDEQLGEATQAEIRTFNGHRDDSIT